MLKIGYCRRRNYFLLFCKPRLLKALNSFNPGVVQNGEPGQRVGKVPDLWWKGCEAESRQERRQNFLLQSSLSELTVTRCPFHPVLPKWPLQDPCHSAQSASGRLHLKTHTPWPDEVGVGWPCCPRIVWEPITETSSHATLKGGLSYSCLSTPINWRLILV